MDSSTFDDLARCGWTYVDAWVNAQQSQQLKTWAQAQDLRFQPAKIAQGLEKSIRGDRTLWIEGHECPAVEDIFGQLEQLKNQLKQELQLPINDLECHLACYPAGTYYQTHLDQGQNAKNGERLITFVLYLNSNWQISDAGHLIIHQEGLRRIEPIEGRLVLFDSQKIYHEVEVTHSPRWSLTGWFRRNSFKV